MQQFGPWLSRQATEQSAIGDLARDHVTPCECSPRRPLSVRGVVEEMSRHGACDAAWDALKSAVSKWIDTAR